MSQTVSSTLDYGVIVLYTLMVIGIGIYFSKEKRNSENYLLGGRKMPHFAVGLACMMSLFSSISIVMIPGEIYNHGLMLFVISGLLGPLLAIPCYLLFTRFYFRLGSFTPYEYLEYRYDKTVRAVVAVSSFYTRVIYIGLVLYTSAKIFEASYGWPPYFSILLVAVVGVFCCFFGGSKAVVWTDVFQALISFGGLLVVAGMLCYKIDGGLWGAITIAFADGHGCPQFRDPEFYTLSPYVRLLFWLLLWGCMATQLTNACSDQVTIQRLLSTKNWKEGLKSQITSVGGGLVFILFLYFIGLALYTYYKQNPSSDLPLGKGDAAFFHFVKELPAPLSGLFMAAMLAAIMSTVSGVTNSMAAVYLKEFHQKFINKKLDDAGEFRVLRCSTLIVGAVGILLALALDFSGKWLQQSISEVGTIFWLLGSAILPAFLFAVLSKRANAKLIWCYTFFAFGEGLALNAWYAMSRASEQAWIADHTAGFGWAGKLDFIYVLPFLIGVAVLMLPYAKSTWRKHRLTKLSALTGFMALGALEAMLLWYFCSQYLINDVPQARSFQFAPPIGLILAFIALWFCPKQPKEKYQGLTLGTVNEPILTQKGPSCR